MFDAKEIATGLFFPHEKMLELNGYEHGVMLMLRVPLRSTPALLLVKKIITRRRHIRGQRLEEKALISQLIKKFDMAQTLTPEIEQWFKSAAWKNGISLEPHPTTDINEFYIQYHANKSAWDQAFQFLKEQDLPNLAPGKHSIDGENVYASVSEAPNNEMENIPWESHRKYNDIQYVIRNREKVGITTADKATITQEYDAAQDIMFYKAEGEAYLFQADQFFIFFPQNLHQPGIKVDNNDPVKKVVVKIRTA